MAYHIGNLIGLRSEVQGHKDGPQLGRSKVGFNILIAIDLQDADAVGLFDPEFDESIG
jgi:hypothetical protein